MSRLSRYSNCGSAVAAHIGAGLLLFVVYSPWIQPHLFLGGFVLSALGCGLKDYMLDRHYQVGTTTTKLICVCSIRTLMGILFATAIGMKTVQSNIDVIRHRAEKADSDLARRPMHWYLSTKRESAVQASRGG